VSHRRDSNPPQLALHRGRKRVSAQGAQRVRIEIRIGSPLWNKQRNARPLLRRAIRQAASLLALHGCEVSVLLADDAAVRGLNRSWRNQDRPTNVLSFPACGGRAHRAGARFLGDIVVAYQMVGREAGVQHKTFAQHLSHLAVHGFLHLLGYDHETDSEATEMERLETMILARLSVPDPYRLPDTAATPDAHA